MAWRCIESGPICMTSMLTPSTVAEALLPATSKDDTGKKPNKSKKKSAA